MKSLKIMALGLAAALVAVSALGAGAASATNLYRYTTPSANDRVALGSEIVMTLQANSSILMKDTGGLANDTCSGSAMSLELEKDTGSTPAAHAQGPLSAITLTGCSHTVTTLSTGALEIKSVAGTTNGTVISRGTRITIKSTVFGISCIANTGAGTILGTLTGAKSPTSRAAFHLDGVVTQENGCGDSPWTGGYLVTTPLGLAMEAS